MGPDPLGAILLSALIPPGDAASRVAAATVIAFICGLFHILYGIFRFGFLDNIVSVPVLRFPFSPFSLLLLPLFFPFLPPSSFPLYFSLLLPFSPLFLPPSYFLSSRHPSISSALPFLQSLQLMSHIPLLHTHMSLHLPLSPFLLSPFPFSPSPFSSSQRHLTSLRPIHLITTYSPFPLNI